MRLDAAARPFLRSIFFRPLPSKIPWRRLLAPGAVGVEKRDVGSENGLFKRKSPDNAGAQFFTNKVYQDIDSHVKTKIVDEGKEVRGEKMENRKLKMDNRIGAGRRTPRECYARSLDHHKRCGARPPICGARPRALRR